MAGRKDRTIAEALRELGPLPAVILTDSPASIKTVRTLLLMARKRHDLETTIESPTMALGGRGRASGCCIMVNGGQALSSALKRNLAMRQVSIGRAVIEGIERAEEGRREYRSITEIMGPPESFTVRPKITPMPWRNTQPCQTPLRVFGATLESVQERYPHKTVRWHPIDEELDTLEIPGM